MEIEYVDSTQLDSDLTSVADAIRAKSGGSSQLAFPAGFLSEIQAIPSGGQSNFELIGTKVFSNLSEYTDTSKEESLDTQINISNTDYAFGYVVVTCDSQVDSSTTWGMTFQTFGRYTNGNVNAGQATQQRGTATLSKAALSSNELNTNSYGVYLKNNVANIVIIRKAYDSTIKKIRAGNYTVKAYGMTELGDDPNICTIEGVFNVSLYHDTGMPTKYKIETPNLDTLLTGMNTNGKSPTKNSGIEEIEVVANSQTVGIALTANMNVNTTYALKKVNFNFVPLANCYQMFNVTYANKAPYFEDCLGLNFALVGGNNYRIGSGFGNCGALKNVTCKPNTLGQLNLIDQTKNWFQINASPLLTDASLCQIANALCATHTSKVQLHSTPKARCSTLMGTVSQVTDDTGTYDFFTADASGTVSLADFITNVKGWTLA